MEHSWHICEEAKNLFVFTFRNDKDKQKVLDKGPWTANENLLLLQDWPDHACLSQIQFLIANFWIRVTGVPLRFFSAENARIIGNKAGKVIQVMVPKPRSSLWGRSLRIRVEVDLCRPLIAGFFMRNEGGVSQWIQLKYEKLPNFCYNCGLLDHLNRDCRASSSAMVSDPFGRTVRLYGSWLSTISPIVSCFNSHLEYANPPHPTFPEEHKETATTPESSTTLVVPTFDKTIHSDSPYVVPGHSSNTVGNATILAVNPTPPDSAQNTEPQSPVQTQPPVQTQTAIPSKVVEHASNVLTNLPPLPVPVDKSLVASA